MKSSRSRSRSRTRSLSRSSSRSRSLSRSRSRSRSSSSSKTLGRRSPSYSPCSPGYSPSYSPRYPPTGKGVAREKFKIGWISIIWKVGSEGFCKVLKDRKPVWAAAQAKYFISMLFYVFLINFLSIFFKSLIIFF